MKKKIIISLAVLLVVWIGYRVYRISTTSSHSPVEIVNFSDNGLDIQVRYCRPYKKGRLIFGDGKQRALLPDGKFWNGGFKVLTGLPPTTGALVPYGKYWRLGANEATEISFNKNISFAGAPVKAGKYRMYAVPGLNTWQVKLNSELGQWGALEANHDLDIVKVEVPVGSTQSETEQFTINFDNDSSAVKMNFSFGIRQ